MRLVYLFFFSFLFAQAFAATPVFADCNITTTLLKVGSRGADVRCLQQKIGIAVDGSFGPVTKIAVMAFQARNGLVPDGIVGLRSLAVLSGISGGVSGNMANYLPGCTSTSLFSTTTGNKCDGSSSLVANKPINGSTAVNVLPPKVLSVSPEKVRSGDTVKIYGENFASTGNTVRLRYGQIEARFENLPSADGKTISFVYQPPEVKTMNKQELLNLPPALLNKILDPVKAVGGSVDDIVAPYRNMKNEDDLRKFLTNNGHSFDELYDKFYVTIENVYGRGSSGGPILAGLRSLEFGPDSNLAILKTNFFQSISSLFDIFNPKKAYAQVPQGGTNSGIIMYCTCGEGYLTTMVDISSNGGSGLYWWSSGFVPNVGTPMIAGAQLGFYIPNAGMCVVGAAPYCAPITAHVASLPWGEAL